MKTVIFANGEIKDERRARNAVQPSDVLIAANGGTANCLKLGFMPSVVIGDLDSLSMKERQALEENGAELIIHPRDKDQTDLELALGYAVEKGADEILLLGLLGGRLDQTLANLLLLARIEWGAVGLIVLEGPDTAYLLKGENSLDLQGKPGNTVSLIPLSPEVTNVRTSGLKWQLASATLSFGSTLSVSNEMVEKSARVSINSGQMLVVHRTQ